MTDLATRVPCTVITGFLGAGKTTLIRHLLENAGGRRLAVLVNEFGDVGIDGEVLKGCGIESCPDENIVELANGCICCTVADDFVPALDRILARPGVDHILIETSGLALPKPLVQAFHWPGVKSRVTVDSVVAVVDGPALAEGRVAQDLGALAAQRSADAALDHDDPVEEVFGDQVACADLIVLSKADLLDAAAREAAQARVARYLGRAVKIVPSERGRVDAAVLLGQRMAVEDEVIDGRRTAHDDEPEHDHDDFDSFIVDLPVVAGPEGLAAKVARVAEECDVLRVKGFAAVEGKPMRLLVQGVGPRVSHHYDRAWAPGEAPATRLVVIGLKGLDRAAVERVLAA